MFDEIVDNVRISFQDFDGSCRTWQVEPEHDADRVPREMVFRSGRRSRVRQVVAGGLRPSPVGRNLPASRRLRCFRSRNNRTERRSGIEVHLIPL